MNPYNNSKHRAVRPLSQLSKAHEHSNPLNTIKGFTLIEILIALTIFAILATITSSTLYYAFNTRTRVNAQSEQLNRLQLAISIIQQDTTQIIERAIRGNEMHLFPFFVGMPDYVEFTRDGQVNPNSNEKRSTLKRIALVCQKDRLLRRTWFSLDSIDRNKYNDKELLNQLSECHFNYITQSSQVLTEWREQALTQNQKKEPMPKAIQLNISIKNWGKMNMLFIIPGALYGSN